ncbi:MAG: short-chain dehydrogenase/reductase [Acidobacteriaceae bacterium]|nr:short-chain dehydrogenase/reductase [Acidobacteriaceae bacterium]
MNLKENTILITGGGSGIGRGLAEAFHKQGNRVIIAGRRRDVLERTASANPGMGTVVLDTTEPESISAAAKEVIRKYANLNVVVNNAGVQYLHDFASDRPLNEAGMLAEIDTNIVGIIRFTSAFLPHLKSKPAASIINISSGLAFLPMARFPIYCATKAFVHSFSMSLRHQIKRTSVRVIELAPPWVATDLDAHQGVTTTHEGMSPMPIPDFIAAAMQDLSTDAEELPVAGAKFLYSAGVSDRAAATFEQIHQ